jgi:hypothetical protein
VRSWCGRHLFFPASSQSTFDLSKPTNHIDEFFSHSWSSSSTLKWLSLCLHHNSVAAVVACLLVGVLAIIGETIGELYILPAKQRCGFNGDLQYISPGPYAAAYFTFLFVLCFRSSMLNLVREPTMFFDKACIEQADSGRRQAALDHIPEFLRCSSKLLVCYDNDGKYFKRLWCAFELAAFVKKERTRTIGFVPITSRLILLPVSRPFCLLLLQFCFCATHFWEYLSGHTAGASQCQTTEAPSLAFARVLWQESMACMLIPLYLDLREIKKGGWELEEMSSFKFDEAKCGDDSDRLHLLHALEDVYEAGEQSVELFERDVRYGSTYGAVKKSLSQHPIGLLGKWHAACAFLPLLFLAFAHAPASLQGQANFCVFYGVVLMVVAPLCRVACLRFHRRFMRRMPTALGSIFMSASFATMVVMAALPAAFLLRLFPAPAASDVYEFLSQGIDTIDLIEGSQQGGATEIEQSDEPGSSGDFDNFLLSL